MTKSPYSKESVRQGILHYLLGRGLAGLAGFATVILLVRYMDVQSYAGFTALTGLIALSGVCASLGLDRAISRYVPEAKLERSLKELGNFIWCITSIRLLASLIVCAIFFVLWEPLLQIFPDVHLTRFPISLIWFVVAETLFQHFSSVLQALIKQKALTRILIVQWAGRLLMIAWIVNSYKQINLEDSIWIMAIPEIAGVFVFFIVILNETNTKKNSAQIKIHSKISAENSWPNWNEIITMAGHNYGFTLLAAPPQGYFMKMLAAVFLPTQMVAAYGFFISIAERVRQYIPLHLLYNLIEPVMIGNYLQNRDFAALNKRCQLLYKSNLILLIPVLAWVGAAGIFIITTLTGGKYQEYLWLLMVVMLQLTVGSHVVLLQLILNSVGKSALLMRAGVIALIGMALFLALAMLFNVQFLVFGPIVFSIICNANIIHALKNQGYPYKLSWQLFWGTGISGIIAFLVGGLAVKQNLLINQPIIISIISGAVVAVVYMACLYFFKAIHLDEIRLVKSIINKKSANELNNIEQLESSNIDKTEPNVVLYLQDAARQVLDTIIPNDAHIILIDYPNTTNVGDSLIWLGEIAYLRSRGFTPSYICDVKNYSATQIKKILNKNSIILMHGGGNFGTMWSEIHNFRLKVLRDFPQVPIIQLPQSIHFNDPAKITEIAEAIKLQGNYTLLARSRPSYLFAQKHFETKIHLCPDMAFFIGSINSQHKPIFDRFILARTDHEKSSDILVESIENLQDTTFEITDWLLASWQERLLHRIEIHTYKLRKILDPNNKLLLILWGQLSHLRFKRGVYLLSKGRVVITDRLHAHVLSVLLNKPHVVIDNIYGKIGNFYKTWTFSHERAKFVTDVAKLHATAEEFDISLSLKQHNGVTTS